jgi:hypothetical protein
MLKRMIFKNTRKEHILKRLEVFNIVESEKVEGKEEESEEREKKISRAGDLEELEREEKLSDEDVEGIGKIEFPEVSTNVNYPEQPEVLISVKYTPKGQRESELLTIRAILTLNYLPIDVKERISETFYRFLRLPNIKIKVPQNNPEFKRVERLLDAYRESILLNDDIALSSKIWRQINSSLITAIEKNWRDKSSSLPNINLLRQGVVLLLYKEAFFLPYYLFAIYPDGKIKKSFETPLPNELLKLEVEKIKIEKQSSTGSLNSGAMLRGLTLEAFLWNLARKIGAIIEEPATLLIEQPSEIIKLDSFKKRETGWGLMLKFFISNFIEEQ